MKVVRGEAGGKETGVLFSELDAVALQHVHHGGVGHDLVLGADLALEQERHGRAALPFLRVVAGQQRDGLAAGRVAADDGRDDGEELGGHGNDAFPVALGGSDDKQGDRPWCQTARGVIVHEEWSQRLPYESELHGRLVAGDAPAKPPGVKLPASAARE